MQVRLANRIAWAYFIVGVGAIVVPIALKPYTQMLVDPLAAYYLLVTFLVGLMHFGLRLFR
jgi:hypothetical protein